MQDERSSLCSLIPDGLGYFSDHFREFRVLFRTAGMIQASFQVISDGSGYVFVNFEMSRLLFTSFPLELGYFLNDFSEFRLLF